MHNILPLLMLVVIGVLAHRVLIHRTFDVCIRCRQGRVNVRGQLTQRKSRRISQFFHELAGDRTLTVGYTYPHRGRALPMHFAGKITEGEKQQIRNFLQSEL